MKHDLTHAIPLLRPGAKWTCYRSTYAGLNWLDESQTKPTESEVNAKIEELDAAEPAKLLRLERDEKLKACDWRASSDLTIDVEWKTYRQELRDLPASATPTLNTDGTLNQSSVTWPTEPS